MLSTSTKVRLLIFGLVSALVVGITAIYYIHLPRLLGFQQIDVTADFADASGIYTNAIVTYRGTDVGRVTAVDLVPGGAKVVMSINDDRHIPADSVASIHSTSAIGEQYVDLVPASADTTSVLHDGSVISRSKTRELPSTDELITRLDGLLQSVPKATLTRTIDDLYTALNGTGPALRTLLTSASDLLTTAQQNVGATNGLMRALGPFLGTQQDLASETTSTVSNLESFSNQLVLSNDDIVTLLRTTPSLVQQAVGLQNDVSPELTKLLANLTSTGKVLKVYDPGTRQLLSILPAIINGLLSIGNPSLKTGEVPVSFHTQAEVPPHCSTGYLPATQRRNPADLRKITNTPLDLYCKLSQSNPIGVRGARNLPCLNNIGVRAASPAQCLGISDAAARRLYDTVTIPGTSTQVDNSGSDGTVAASQADVVSEGTSPANQRGSTWQALLLGPIGK